MDEKSEAISLWLPRETRSLRRLPFAELGQLVDAPRMWLRPFRSSKVALAAMAAPVTETELIVLVRAYVLLRLDTPFVAWDGFTKEMDGSWRGDIPDALFEQLRSRIDQLAPML